MVKIRFKSSKTSYGISAIEAILIRNDRITEYRDLENTPLALALQTRWIRLASDTMKFDNFHLISGLHAPSDSSHFVQRQRVIEHLLFSRLFYVIVQIESVIFTWPLIENQKNDSTLQFQDFEEYL